jgi:hypothetical protein
MGGDLVGRERHDLLGMASPIRTTAPSAPRRFLVCGRDDGSVGDRGVGEGGLAPLYLGLASGVGFAGTIEAIAVGFGEIMAEVGCSSGSVS